MIPGVFALINVYAVLKYLQTFMSKSEFKAFFFVSIIVSAAVVLAAVMFLTYAGRYLYFTCFWFVKE